MLFYCETLVEAPLRDGRPLVCFQLLMYALAVLHRHVQDLVHVLDEVGFDLLVDWGVMIEGW